MDNSSSLAWINKSAIFLLMPMSSLKKSREEIIEKLHSWAEKNESLDHPYISGIYEALSRDSNLEYWAQYSAAKELPETKSSTIDKLITRAKKVEQFRNVMIFTPIAFTWASIAIAATSYATFTKENLSINLNFLDFWENGYGSLPAIWKLSNVAIVDFLLILSIIIASIIANRLENRIDDEEFKLESSEIEERVELAFKIDLFLFQYLRPTPVILNRSVQNSIRALSRISKELNSSSKKMAGKESLLPQIKSLQKQIERLDRDLKRKR
jgi:hypothetical protein